MNVTDCPDLWKDTDPIHPGLGVDFKTAPGRDVVGLQGDDELWKAFMCFARTIDVPKSLEELIELTDPLGNIVVPYTVWSLEKGAGRKIIEAVLERVSTVMTGVTRVVTLSPLTDMAERFHLRNGASKLRTNEETVNFEYDIY